MLAGDSGRMLSCMPTVGWCLSEISLGNRKLSPQDSPLVSNNVQGWVWSVRLMLNFLCSLITGAPDSTTHDHMESDKNPVRYWRLFGFLRAWLILTTKLETPNHLEPKSSAIHFACRSTASTWQHFICLLYRWIGLR